MDFMENIQKFVTPMIENVEQVIVGKRAAIEFILVALSCEGHILLEDVPGSGKTMLARSMATSLWISFKRIQCTPDLLLNDITGVSIFNQKSGEFEFRPGPIFVNILLADEINRATPRTQAALLEAMQEHQVTVDGITHDLPRPFLVLATQNPIEYEGTFPVPEAQLDRFLMRLTMGYPSSRRGASDTDQSMARASHHKDWQSRQWAEHSFASKESLGCQCRRHLAGLHRCAGRSHACSS
jgi:MoxR-like ATPase